MDPVAFTTDGLRARKNALVNYCRWLTYREDLAGKQLISWYQNSGVSRSINPLVDMKLRVSHSLELIIPYYQKNTFWQSHNNPPSTRSSTSTRKAVLFWQKRTKLRSSSGGSRDSRIRIARKIIKQELILQRSRCLKSSSIVYKEPHASCRGK